MFIHPCLLLVVSLYACTTNAAEQATASKVDTPKGSDADKKSAADSKEKKRESDDFTCWVMIELAKTDGADEE